MGRAMKKTIIAAALALPLLLTGCGSAEASDGVSDRFDHTGSGIQSIRIITDTETGVSTCSWPTALATPAWAA